MAESEGLDYCECCGKPMQTLFTREYVNSAIEVARQEEREECAKICDNIYNWYSDRYDINKDQYYEGGGDAATDCAEEIRKRGKK